MDDNGKIDWAAFNAGQQGKPNSNTGAQSEQKSPVIMSQEGRNPTLHFEQFSDDFKDERK